MILVNRSKKLPIKTNGIRPLAPDRRKTEIVTGELTSTSGGLLGGVKIPTRRLYYPPRRSGGYFLHNSNRKSKSYANEGGLKPHDKSSFFRRSV